MHVAFQVLIRTAARIVEETDDKDSVGLYFLECRGDAFVGVHPIPCPGESLPRFCQDFRRQAGSSPPK